MTQELGLHRPALSVRRMWCIRLGWLAVVLAALLYCGVRLHDGTALQTNLLSLLPDTAADPVAEKAVDTLATSLGDRAVFLLSSSNADHAKAAAMQFGSQLKRSKAFRTVIAQLPPFDTAQITRFYLPYRFSLLSAADRATLDDTSTALPTLLAQRLYVPVEAGLSAPLADDPFGWLSHWLAGLPLAATRLELEDNLLITRRGDTTSVLVTGTLAASAYDGQTQADVRTAVAQAEQSLARTFPDVTLVRTGAVFYAAAARSASEQELHRIGIISTLGIALLMLWVFRSPRFLLLGFLSTAIGIVFALAATMLVFGKLHLLTLVFGASLIGEAVDYSIQYFVGHLGAQGQDARRTAREVRPALLVALATSLLGYAILVGVPFPALRQIACFAIAGIGAAFLSVASLLPALLTNAPRQPYRTYDCAARWLGRWQAALTRRGAWVCLALIAAAAVPGWLRLTSDDDIHLLIQRDPDLARQEAFVREAIGVENSTQFFVVKGDSAEQVLQRAETLQHKLELPIAGASLKGVQSVAQFVPSAHQQAEDRARLSKRVSADPQALRATLTDAGFRPEIAAKYVAAVEAAPGSPLTVDAWLAMPWSQPYRHLWLGQVSSAGAPPMFAAIVIPTGVTTAQLPALAALADATPGIRFVDKPASVARLFATYRVDSGWWLAGALSLILMLFCLRYGVAAGVRVTLPVVCAVGITFAVYGYAGIPLNLFHWLALMLVLGVGANYAVFLREGCARQRADIGGVWVGVLLSASTTLLSFGLLGTSAMPVLRSFGMTLALGIVIAVALAPLGMPIVRHRPS
ncbi:MMPL family transporter [Ralstonia sp. CHL-2022]|uniref:MMPL family transporter n=1 Tax=Ralstonia mojiangensis TaxID=2953895 RepID=A0ABT2LAG2_9RALS|nr:MMPL family transporter [Ralstonia mojiangensis]MCT7298707.1 MMPL family transporter [Ralstonia mojiangensis]MCT7311649.1 MMPL family transporter [Ralstonia mojiangensis]